MKSVADSKLFDYRVIFVTLLHVTLFFFAPDNKFIFLVSFLHLISLTFLLKNVALTLIYAYLPWFVFEQGRSFEIVLVPFEGILSPNYLSPVVAVFNISPMLFLSFLMILYLVITNFSYKIIKLIGVAGIISLLLSYLFVRLLSAFLTEYASVFSIMGVINESSFFLWMAIILFEIHKSKSSIEAILSNILAIIGILFSFELVLSIGQLFAGGYFGLHSERAHYIAQFGMGADENASLLRVSGFKYHPNGLADWLVQTASAGFLLAGILQKKLSKVINQHVLLVFIFLLIIISAVTLNRVTLVTLLFALLLYVRPLISVFISLKPPLKKFFDTNFGKILMTISIVFSLLAVFRIAQRVFLSLFVFSEHGGISTRLIQYQEALELFFKKPFFGSGPDMYTAALYQWIPNGEILYFPERVHNGFLLIAVESGVFAIFLVMVLFGFLLKFALASNFRNIALLIIFHTFINMMLHRIDTHFLTISGMVLILAFAYEKKYFQHF